MSLTPELWGARNVETGRLRATVFKRREVAEAFVRSNTDNYTALEVVPLYARPPTADGDVAGLAEVRAFIEAELEDACNDMGAFAQEGGLVGGGRYPIAMSERRDRAKRMLAALSAPTKSDDLRDRLRACCESLRLAAEHFYGPGKEWAPWSHPANSIRWAEELIGSTAFSATPAPTVTPADADTLPGGLVGAALSLPPAAQHKLAERIAANIGFELTPEPEHPDSPHARAKSDELRKALELFCIEQRDRAYTDIGGAARRTAFVEVLDFLQAKEAGR